jgi:hypothetical protein
MAPHHDRRRLADIAAGHASVLAFVAGGRPLLRVPAKCIGNFRRHRLLNQHPPGPPCCRLCVQRRPSAVNGGKTFLGWIRIRSARSLGNLCRNNPSKGYQTRIQELTGTDRCKLRRTKRSLLAGLMLTLVEEFLAVSKFAACPRKKASPWCSRRMSTPWHEPARLGRPAGPTRHRHDRDDSGRWSTWSA